MTIAVGQHTSVTSAFTNGLTTTGITTSASGSNFYVFVGVSSAGPPTVSDSKSNTYSLVTSDTTGDFNGINVYAFKCENGTGGASHTVTVNQANVGMVVAFVEVTGAATSGSIDVSNHNGTNATSTTINTATVTTTNANDLILSFWKGSNTGNTSVAANTGAGYAIVNSGTANPAFAVSSRVVSSTGTYGDTYTLGTADYAGTITLAILPAGAGPPPPVGNSLIRTPGPGPGYPFNALLMLGRTGSTVVPPGGSSALVFGQTGTLTGAGALAGTSALLFGQTGALTGAGTLTGSSALVFGQTGTLTQTGLQGTSGLVFGQSGTLTAAGILAGSSALQFGQTGALLATGALTGSSALTFGQTAALTAAGILAGSSALTFAQTAALAASGALTGTSALIFGASATADNPTGAMVGSAALTIGATGALTGFGALIGNGQITFNASGFVPQAAIQDAGRKRIRTIYRIVIDGQEFLFRTLQEAKDFLNRAKETALTVAQKVEQGEQPKPKPPVIQVPKELRPIAYQIKRDIEDAYEQAAQTAELRLLIELNERQEEDTIFWLL